MGLTDYESEMKAYKEQMEEILNGIESIKEKLLSSLDEAKKEDGWENVGTVKTADTALKKLATDIIDKREKLKEICRNDVDIAARVDAENKAAYEAEQAARQESNE